MDGGLLQRGHVIANQKKPGDLSEISFSSDDFRQCSFQDAAEIIPLRLYVDRVARRHCRHRHSCRAAFARVEPCQAKRTASRLHFQSPANRPRVCHVCQRPRKLFSRPARFEIQPARRLPSLQTTWPPSDPRAGWAGISLQNENPSLDIWSCPAAINSTVGNIVQSAQMISTNSADTNAPLCRYWAWRFDRPDDPVSLEDFWGKTESEAVSDLESTNDPTVGPSTAPAMSNWS